MTIKKTILVTAVSGDIGGSAVRSLHEAGHRILGCDLNPHTPVAALLHRFYVAPPARDADVYLRFLHDVAGSEGVDIIVPISEPEISLLNARREVFRGSSVKLLLNNPTIIDHFLDKLKTARYLSAIGIRTPKTSLLREYDGSFGFPVIVKPRTGCGSKKLWVAHDPADLDYVMRKGDGTLVVQEYIGSDAEEYTTGVFSDGKKTSSITFRRKLGFGGLSMEACLVDVPFIENMAIRVAEVTRLIGSINIQTRRVGSENMYIPFEINPRISSTLLFRKKFGFDDLVWWVDAASDMSYSYQKIFSSGTAVRYVSECYFDMVDLGQ